MANLANLKTHAGHTVRILVGGVEIGRIQSLSARRNFGMQGVYQVGSIMPQEHTATRYEGTITVDRFFVRKSIVGQLVRSIRDQLKQYAGYSESTPLGEEDLIMNLDILDIILEDKYSGVPIRKYMGCSLGDYTETIRANAIAGENATFMYLECSDA